MVKIAFDAQLFLRGNKTGIGWCADNVIKTLSETGEYECQLNYFALGYDAEKLSALKEYQELGIKLRPCRWFHDIWYKFIWPFVPIPYSLFFGKGCQITQFFNFVIPPGIRGKKITFVHDMAHLACPETVRARTRRWLTLTLKKSCNRADVIITVSEFSKGEIIKYLGIAEEKIVVMPAGVDFELFRPDYPTEFIEMTKEKYGISGEYFLYLGTIEPRKNIRRMIEAYSLLRDRRKDAPKLVLAGGKGWLCDSIYEWVETLNVKDDIIFTGYVDEQETPLLLSGARAFLFPSLYEGFGTPPVEAMACGTPVISSNTASMPEVIGDAGILVNPYSVKEISSAMEMLLLNEELQESLVLKGGERVKKYTWENSATVLKKVYSNLTSGQNTKGR